MKNQIGIILGFSELILGELDADAPRRQDVEEIRTAALRAIDLLSAQPHFTEAGTDE